MDILIRVLEISNEILHIPLVLFGAEVENIEREGLVSQLDIDLIILDFLEFSISEHYRRKSLFSSDRDLPVISFGFPK